MKRFTNTAFHSFSPPRNFVSSRWKKFDREHGVCTPSIKSLRGPFCKLLLLLSWKSDSAMNEIFGKFFILLC